MRLQGPIFGGWGYQNSFIVKAFKGFGLGNTDLSCTKNGLLDWCIDGISPK